MWVGAASRALIVDMIAFYHRCAGKFVRARRVSVRVAARISISVSLVRSVGGWKPEKKMALGLLTLGVEA